MVTSIEMGDSHGPDKLDFVFQLFTSMQKDNLNYIYRGMFSQRIMETILGMAESNIVTIEEKSVIKKRVYHIMVECLQNITRHQAPVLDDYSEDASLFILQKKHKKYYITTGNIIEPELITDLKYKIEKINSLSQTELKEYYRKMLVNGMLSEKGGAGLGLIDMARKSGNKLAYHFKEINEDKAFFFLTTEVFAHEQDAEKAKNVSDTASASILDIESLPDADGLFSIESISELHDLLNDNNIKIIFNNYFNTESLETLLIFLDKQICETLNIDRKVYTVMVELFLNIIIHGSNPVEHKRYKGNPGLFFIREVDGRFVINASNYITSDKIELFLTKIDYVNNMTTEDTDAMEESIDVQKIVSEKGGLGLASIKQITKNNIDVHLCKVDDEYTFLTIGCTIAKLPKDVPVPVPVVKDEAGHTDDKAEEFLYDVAELTDESETIGEIEDMDEFYDPNEILDESEVLEEVDSLDDFYSPDDILDESEVLEEIDSLEDFYNPEDILQESETIEEIDSLEDFYNPLEILDEAEMLEEQDPTEDTESPSLQPEKEE